MSNSHKGVLNHQFGKPHTVETKQKISLAEKGKINSASARLKMSKAHLGSRNHMFGKHHTLETKQKISLARQKSIEPIPNNLEPIPTSLAVLRLRDLHKLWCERSRMYRKTQDSSHEIEHNDSCASSQDRSSQGSH